MNGATSSRNHLAARPEAEAEKLARRYVETGSACR